MPSAEEAVTFGIPGNALTLRPSVDGLPATVCAAWNGMQHGPEQEIRTTLNTEVLAHGDRHLYDYHLVARPSYQARPPYLVYRQRRRLPDAVGGGAAHVGTHGTGNGANGTDGHDLGGLGRGDSNGFYANGSGASANQHVRNGGALNGGHHGQNSYRVAASAQSGRGRGATPSDVKVQAVTRLTTPSSFKNAGRPNATIPTDRTGLPAKQRTGSGQPVFGHPDAGCEPAHSAEKPPSPAKRPIITVMLPTPARPGYGQQSAYLVTKGVTGGTQSAFSKGRPAPIA